jgi:hypothetical protein
MHGAIKRNLKRRRKVSNVSENNDCSNFNKRTTNQDTTTKQNKKKRKSE